MDSHRCSLKYVQIFTQYLYQKPGSHNCQYDLGALARRGHLVVWLELCVGIAALARSRFRRAHPDPLANWFFGGGSKMAEDVLVVRSIECYRFPLICTPRLLRSHDCTPLYDFLPLVRITKIAERMTLRLNLVCLLTE